MRNIRIWKWKIVDDNIIKSVNIDNLRSILELCSIEIERFECLGCIGLDIIGYAQQNWLVIELSIAKVNWLKSNGTQGILNNNGRRIVRNVRIIDWNTLKISIRQHFSIKYSWILVKSYIWVILAATDLECRIFNIDEITEIGKSDICNRNLSLNNNFFCIFNHYNSGSEIKIRITQLYILQDNFPTIFKYISRSAINGSHIIKNNILNLYIRT